MSADEAERIAEAVFHRWRVTLRSDDGFTHGDGVRFLSMLHEAFAASCLPAPEPDPTARPTAITLLDVSKLADLEVWTSDEIGRRRLKYSESRELLRLATLAANQSSDPTARLTDTDIERMIEVTPDTTEEQFAALCTWSPIVRPEVA